MPTLYDLIFGEPEKLAEKKSQFADIIERGLRVGRGETFEEPLSGFSLLQNEPVGGETEPIKFDQPGFLQAEVDEFKSLVKGLTRASEKGVDVFVNTVLGSDQAGMKGTGPQSKVATSFEQNLDPTISERVLETVGEFAPQVIGGVAAPGIKVGAALGASEEILAGGSPAEIGFSTLGGGVGGLLMKIGAKVGADAFPRILPDLRRELTAIERAVDTGVEHIVPRPDFDLFPEVPVAEWERILGESIRTVAREGVPGTGAEFSRVVPDIQGASVPSLGDIAQPKLFEDFAFTVPAPKRRPGASYTEVLGEYITKQADETGVPVEEAFEKFNSTVVFPATPNATSGIFTGKVPLPKSAKELVNWRNELIFETMEKFRVASEGVSPLQKTHPPFPKKNMVLRQADTIIAKYLRQPDGPFAGYFKHNKITRPQDFVASFINQTPDISRMKFASELERAGLDSPAPEAFAAAKEVAIKSLGDMPKKEARALVESLDPDVVVKMARQYDSSAGNSAKKVTAAMCEALARGKK